MGSPNGIHSPITHGTNSTDAGNHQDLFKAASRDTLSELPMVKGLTRNEQIKKLADLFRQRNKMIGVFYSHSQSQKADKILHRLHDLLYGGESVAQGFKIEPEMASWLQRALFSGVNYFIFVGLPPTTTTNDDLPRSQSVTETTYFDTKQYIQREAEVVVVSQNKSQHTHTCNFSLSQ